MRHRRKAIVAWGLERGTFLLVTQYKMRSHSPITPLKVSTLPASPPADFGTIRISSRWIANNKYKIMSWQYTKNLECETPVAYLVAQDETILLRLRNCCPGQQDLGWAHSFSRDILRRSRGNCKHTALSKSRNRSNISDHFSSSPYLPRSLPGSHRRVFKPKRAGTCFRQSLLLLYSFYIIFMFQPHNFLPVHLRNDNVCNELNI